MFQPRDPFSLSTGALPFQQLRSVNGGVNIPLETSGPLPAGQVQPNAGAQTASVATPAPATAGGIDQKLKEVRGVDSRQRYHF